MSGHSGPHTLQTVIVQKVTTFTSSFSAASKDLRRLHWFYPNLLDIQVIKSAISSKIILENHIATLLSPKFLSCIGHIKGSLAFKWDFCDKWRQKKYIESEETPTCINVLGL